MDSSGDVILGPGWTSRPRSLRSQRTVPPGSDVGEGPLRRGQTGSSHQHRATGCGEDDRQDEARRDGDEPPLTGSEVHEARAASQRRSPLRGHRHAQHPLPGHGASRGRRPLRLHPPPRGRRRRGNRQAPLCPDRARRGVLPSAPRGAPGPETRKRGVLSPAGGGEADGLWVQQLIPTRDDVGHELRVAGVLGSRDSAGRRVRRSGCGYLVSRGDPVHVGVWSSSVPGNQRQRDSGDDSRLSLLRPRTRFRRLQGSDLQDAPEGSVLPGFARRDRGPRLAARAGQRPAQPGGAASLALGGPLTEFSPLRSA
ncbi:hypothetical protein E3U43_004993 [Larimichthys crocea]|uniref:Uncharacterized protein n=1 Tax=Larimichthys crocea TaxID=215358 RepID=A0ACD3QF65_LARCR|nr:hypothetical protein E3U43_004993 [Larimichthys crocea]